MLQHALWRGSSYWGVGWMMGAETHLKPTHPGCFRDKTGCPGSAVQWILFLLASLKVYTANNLNVVTKIRTEQLTEEEKRRYKGGGPEGLEPGLTQVEQIPLAGRPAGVPAVAPSSPAGPESEVPGRRASGSQAPSSCPPHQAGLGGDFPPLPERKCGLGRWVLGGGF